MEATIIAYIYMDTYILYCICVLCMHTSPCTFMYVSAGEYMLWCVCGQRTTSSVILALCLICDRVPFLFIAVYAELAGPRILACLPLILP